MKAQTIKLAIVQLTFESGKSTIETMTAQQLAGLKKSKRRKTILAKLNLATIEIKIRHTNQPL